LRAIANRVCTNQVENEFITPYKIKGDNLSGIGIAGKYQAPSFNVYVTEQEQHEMATNLYLLNHTLPRIKINKILQGQMTFLVRAFIMRGRADWCNNIKKFDMPKLVDYEGWKQTIINNESWNNRHKKDVLLQCSKCLRWDPIKSHNFTILNVDKQITCHHCHKQTMSKAWTCPCGENWFVCNTHKWYAKNGNSTISPDDTNSRPTKSTKVDHHPAIKQNVQFESDKNSTPNKAQKKEHTDAGVPIQGECDPNLMASHQELLEYELK